MSEFCGDYSVLVREEKETRPANLVGLLGATFTRLTARIQNWMACKQAEAQLNDMSERELRDMGLHRGNIAAAVRGRLGNDNQARHAA